MSTPTNTLVSIEIQPLNLFSPSVMIHLVLSDPKASPVVCPLLLVPVLVSSKLNSINPSVLQVLDCTLPFKNKRISRKERETS